MPCFAYSAEMWLLTEILFQNLLIQGQKLHWISSLVCFKSEWGCSLKVVLVVGNNQVQTFFFTVCQTVISLCNFCWYLFLGFHLLFLFVLGTQVNLTKNPKHPRIIPGNHTTFNYMHFESYIKISFFFFVFDFYLLKNAMKNRYAIKTDNGVVVCIYIMCATVLSGSLG